MKLLKSFFCISIILFFSSCKIDDDSFVTPENQNPNPTAFAENFGSEITRTFLGTVVDNNDNPLSDVSISIGTSIATTDANGVFIINDATVNERFGYVKAEKVGFIHASRAVVPSDGTNKVHIMMLPETVAGSTSSGTQETISLTNGASVALDGNYANPDGSAYSGVVNVIMHHLDPTDENMQDQMPGMLYAANAQNEERMLQTFGMLAVELRGEAGEDLNLAEGSTAEITVPLDPSLVASAPATIPLWYFDEDQGYWIEEGFATLVGNNYVGIVSHFSFWNCDIPAEAVNLCVTLVDANNSPISNLLVKITSDVFGARSDITNENGEVCGLVPSNESLEITITGFGLCGTNILYIGAIGPFDSDSEITIIPEDILSDGVFEQITGTFLDCNELPVTDGYVEINYNEQTFITYVNNGVFNVGFLRCTSDNSFIVKGYDFNNMQETDALNYTFTTPNTNLGTIQSCSTVEEFITYQAFDNITATYNFIINCSIAEDNLFVNWTSPIDNNLNIGITISSFDGVGTYTDDNISIYIVDSNINTTFNNVFTGVVNVNYVGDVGDYIDANFSGVITVNGYQEIPITGSMHVIRDN